MFQNQMKTSWLENPQKEIIKLLHFLLLDVLALFSRKSCTSLSRGISCPKKNNQMLNPKIHRLLLSDPRSVILCDLSFLHSGINLFCCSVDQNRIHWFQFSGYEQDFGGGCQAESDWRWVIEVVWWRVVQAIRKAANRASDLWNVG